ncbi:M15 family metallopeptidase [Brevibacillus ruminantium]|uniref:D-alanyl-D-alanine dipeptidase n=1 Tax=Brevibacillus ruminantium TaxID=2950604 RepID=A0ABY4WBJ6_9BACL|nr:M15 family metallopeptidase [Brevibacillus ruminantium]USG64545.1 M15 family metallopeptidase [Brevibacillus ruminantium]
MKQDIPIPRELRQLAEFPELKECGEDMLPLSSLSDKITICPMYYQQGYAGTSPEAYLRKSAALRLAEAAKGLPDGYRFVIFDGWRSYQVQASLYDGFKQKLLKQGWQEGELLQNELSKFVAVPSDDVTRPSPHLSGGAVDLTIEGPEGWLDMGTDFDDFSERAATRYYESIQPGSQRDEAIRANRRLLFHLMSDAGFVNYPKEWWHFEYGTLSWAKRTSGQAMYGGVLHLFDKRG